MRRAAALTAAMLLGLAACGDEEGAAEPADAPPVGATPAGTVVELAAGQAEGIVADPVTHLVAIGTRDPLGLALVDGRTGTETARVPISDRLRHLQLAEPGGPVLVPSESEGAVLLVDLPSGEVRSRVPIGAYAHDAAALPDGTIAAADEMGEGLALVREGEPAHRFTDLTQPGGVAAVDGLVGVVDVHEHTLSLYDPSPPARAGRVGAGDGPTHLVTDRRGRLVVTDTRGDALLVFQTRPELRQVGEVPLPGAPYGITYDPRRDRVWVTLTARNEVVGIDLTADPPQEMARFPTVRQPNTVAVDADTGRVFVASRTDGTLQLIDP